MRAEKLIIFSTARSHTHTRAHIKGRKIKKGKFLFESCPKRERDKKEYMECGLFRPVFFLSLSILSYGFLVASLGRPRRKKKPSQIGDFHEGISHRVPGVMARYYADGARQIEKKREKISGSQGRNPTRCDSGSIVILAVP